MARLRNRQFILDSPIDLEAYLDATEENESWQDELDGLLRDLHVDPRTLPSIEDIQAALGRYIPYEDSLSDLVVAMREE